MKTRQDFARRLTAWCAVMLGLMAGLARAQVYQWSTSVDDYVSGESKGHPRAFLWVPEQCKQVRAVVVALQNMQEEQLFKDADFRKTMADLDFAIVWITPPMGTMEFRFDQDDPRRLEAVLGALADQSGYAEIRTAPLVPLGHSASASWCWDVAAWNPGRTLAVLSLSGQWPYFSAKFWGDRSVDGVPGLTTKGEFEIGGSLEKGWYAGLKGDYYKAHANAAFTQVVEPGGEHFSASKEKIALIDLYLHKVVQYRLPPAAAGSGPITLKPIDAGKSGWRYEVWHLDRGPDAPAAPVATYKGKDNFFWAFDEEMAKAIEAFQGTQRNKVNTLLAYRQKDGFTDPQTDHMEVHLKFQPLDDALTFKLTGGFFDKVPGTKDGKVAGWQNMLGEGVRTVNQGDDIDHPTGQDDRLNIDVLCGPVVKLSRDTFAIRFDRTGMDNPKRNANPCFILTYPGDDKYKRMAERSVMSFPLKNTRGKTQTITFTEIADVKATNLAKPLQLAARSDSGLKVYYYVREGPAEVDDQGKVTFTPIPPKAKYPIAVTVVAWQWGRSIEPALQSATPVERTFHITP